ncbi:MAG: protein-export chaperone SecB [Clostridia bacterium]|nr:protein-export chaperone SecB [Clostridia bacterium]
MERTNLKGFNVSDVKVINHLAPGVKISLKNNYNYNMHPINDTTCVGEFTVNVTDSESEDKLSVTVKCTGLFEHSKEKNQTEIHVESMAEMFPYVKSFVATLTLNMGMAPIYLPPIDYANISIVNIKIPPKQ